jgi:hypothetical protein
MSTHGAAAGVTVQDIAKPDRFWDAARSSAEFRDRLRTALMDELGYEGKRRAQAVAHALGFEPIHRSPAEILFLVDELVAQVRREERTLRVLSGGADER